jgi:4-hydroxy-tetrahydrodipicolinate reductase
MSYSLCVLGATGKMGKRILYLAQNDADFHFIQGVTHSSPYAVIIDESGAQIPLSANLNEALEDCDVAIDFTSPQGLEHHLDAAIRANVPLVIGTTGLSEGDHEKMRQASLEIPILYSPNFSLGMSLCLQAAEQIGSALFGNSHIDIFETHHMHKKDSPSGTALALAKAIGNGVIVNGNQKTFPRHAEEIAIHSTREGEIVGEHTLVLECGHERIELKHTAHSRDAFAQGALIAAKFLAPQDPGFYSIKNILTKIKQ